MQLIAVCTTNMMVMAGQLGTMRSDSLPSMATTAHEMADADSKYSDLARLADAVRDTSGSQPPMVIALDNECHKFGQSVEDMRAEQPRADNQP